MITVDECRPYMLALNGAFESAGRPAAVAGGMGKKETKHGTVRYSDGIEERSLRVIQRQQFFSELGGKWAEPGISVDLNGYSRFPSVNMELIAEEESEGQRTERVSESATV